MAVEPRRDHPDDAVPFGIKEFCFLSTPIRGEKSLPVLTRRRSEGRQRFASMTQIERDVRLRDFDYAVER
jgi:hypothetical protein